VSRTLSLRPAATLRPLVLLGGLMLALTAYRIWAIGHLGLDLFVDEAQYWFWSTELAWGYYSKPPAIALLIKITTAVFGDGPLGVKAPALLLQALSPFVAYAIGNRVVGPRAGFWAALAVATAPVVAGLAVFVSTDSPLIFFWLLGAFALLNAIERDRWGDWLLLGACVGLGLLSKYTMVAFGLSAALALLLLPRGRARLASLRPWIAVALALALFAPNVLWNARLGFPTFVHVAEITHQASPQGGLGTAAEFLVGQWALTGPVLGTVAVLALLRLGGWLRHEQLAVLALLTAPLLGIGIVQAWRGGANVNWAAPSLVMAALFAVIMLARADRWRLIAAGVAINLLLGVLVLQWPDLVRASGSELTARNDPFKRMRGWSALMTPVQAAVAQHPNAMVVAVDRELLSQIAYHVRPAQFAAWHPGGRPNNHFQLTRPLPPGLRGEVLLVHWDSPPAVVERFGTAQVLVQHVVPVVPGLQRRVEVVLLREFKGYP
jgi:4-amino-4-deoxy-L-arabinose transferase-like glycosyltransferase